MRELAGNFEEIMQELIASGMEPADALRAAQQRFGDHAEIAARFNAVYNTASWKSAFLAAAPIAALGVTTA